MKAVQTRSPIHLAYEYANLNNVIVSIWVSDSPNIDSTTTPDYQLNSQAINDFASVEISELIRSKNDYIFNPDFYEKRDTAKYVLVKAVLLDSSNSELEVKYDFLKARDGYLRRADGVTVKELPQVYKNLIPTDVRDWNSNSNVTITADQPDAFGGGDAYLVEDTVDSSRINVQILGLTLKGINTFSVWVKKKNTDLFKFQLNSSVSRSITVNISNLLVTNVGSFVLSYDIFKLGEWLKISMCIEDDITGANILSLEPLDSESIFLFNPIFIKGNLINFNASELILQDNYEVFTDQNISFMADKKYTNGDYVYYNTNLKNINNQSEELNIEFIEFAEKPENSNWILITESWRDVGVWEDNIRWYDVYGSFSLIYDDLGNNETNQKITYNQINECKHTPTKVSFINRFGVIQDLVFFKKRTDNIDTNKESYKTNVLQQGNYYPHIGQNQTIRKESKRSVILNSGFYPEEFNTVFEQLQNSLHYWIDDEPAVLEGSSFNVKTRVNDKLINYTFDFSYSNEEVNTI